MEIVEKNFYKKGQEKSNQERLSSEEEDAIMKEILMIKKSAETKIDPLNIHLKDVPEAVLRDSLKTEDLMAFKKVFSGKWDERIADIHAYEESVKKWEKIEEQDSGVSPKVVARRKFATMLQHYLISKSVENKLIERDEHKKAA